MNAIDWELAEGLDNKFMHELAEAAMLAEEDTSSKRYHIKDDVALESSLLTDAVTCVPHSTTNLTSDVSVCCSAVDADGAIDPVVVDSISMDTQNAIDAIDAIDADGAVDAIDPVVVGVSLPVSRSLCRADDPLSTPTQLNSSTTPAVAMHPNSDALSTTLHPNSAELVDAKFVPVTSLSAHTDMLELAVKVESHRRQTRHEYQAEANKLFASLYCHNFLADKSNSTRAFNFEADLKAYGVKRKHTYQTRKLLKVFKDLEVQGYIDKVKNYSNLGGGAGHTAVYVTTELFEEETAAVRIHDITPDPTAPRITLKVNAKIADLPETDSIARDTAILDAHLELVRTLGVTDKHGEEWPLAYFKLTRQYKNNTDSGGRLYAPFQNMKSGDRTKLKLNGEPAAAIDFSSMHPAILYRESMKETLTPAQYEVAANTPYEPYAPRNSYKHLRRAGLKTLLNALLNCTDKTMALRLLANARVVDGGGAISTEWKYKGNRRRVFPNRNATLTFCSAMEIEFPELAPHFYSGVGLRLQKVDSDIMMAAINIANKCGVVCLPVHDELIFPYSYQQFGLDALEAATSIVLGDLVEHAPLKVTTSPHRPFINNSYTH